MNDRDIMEGERLLAATYGLPRVMVERIWQLAEQVRGRCLDDGDPLELPDLPPEIVELQENVRAMLGLSRTEMTWVTLRGMIDCGLLPADAWPYGDIPV